MFGRGISTHGALVAHDVHQRTSVVCQLEIVDDRSHHFIRFMDKRMGNFVFRAISKRAFTIFLHAPWPPFGGYSGNEYAADGVIDAFIATLPASQRRLGFDTRGTPFGELTGNSSVYAQGYDHFTLWMFCDGYSIQKPLSEYVGVTTMPGFINAANLDRRRRARAVDVRILSPGGKPPKSS